MHSDWLASLEYLLASQSERMQTASKLTEASSWTHHKFHV